MWINLFCVLNEHQLNVPEVKKKTRAHFKRPSAVDLINVATHICRIHVINDNLHCFTFNSLPLSATERHFVLILTEFCWKMLMTL